MIKTDDLIGIPFVDGGRDTQGLDCWGLVKLIYQRQGIEVDDYAVSAIDTVEIEKCMTGYSHTKWRKLDAPVEGACVLFRLLTNTSVNHAGIVLDGDFFIHAYLGAGVCIDRLKKWKSRIVGYYMPTSMECVT